MDVAVLLIAGILLPVGLEIENRCLFARETFAYRVFLFDGWQCFEWCFSSFEAAVALPAGL
jgi:hypothetical protein